MTELIIANEQTIGNPSLPSVGGAMQLIRTIEEASLNAWPSHTQRVLDGWQLRFANGYTRRSNSVNPIHPGAMDTSTKIAVCEHIYRDSPLGCVFKITPLAQPPGLEGLLEELGYRRDAETSVQVLPDLSSLPQSPDGEGELLLEEGIPGPWLNLFCRMNRIAEQHRISLAGILAQIRVRRAFATLSVGGAPVACGLGVLEGESLGLFDIVTEPGHRRKGHSDRLMAGLMAWAGSNGAGLAYLQVMLDNAPALRLYEKLGFAEIYRYWYRLKP